MENIIYLIIKLSIAVIGAFCSIFLITKAFISERFVSLICGTILSIIIFVSTIIVVFPVISIYSEEKILVAEAINPETLFNEEKTIDIVTEEGHKTFAFIEEGTKYIKDTDRKNNILVTKRIKKYNDIFNSYKNPLTTNIYIAEEIYY